MNNKGTMLGNSAHYTIRIKIKVSMLNIHLSNMTHSQELDNDIIPLSSRTTNKLQWENARDYSSAET